MADQREFDPNDPLAPRALEPVLFRFTPPFEGAYLRGAPQRDLTESDLQELPLLLRRDALAPHPGHGTPLYTATTEGQAWLAAIDAAAAEIDAEVAAQAAAEAEAQAAAEQGAATDATPAPQDQDGRKRKKAGGADQESAPGKDGDQ